MTDTSGPAKGRSGSAGPPSGRPPADGGGKPGGPGGGGGGNGGGGGGGGSRNRNRSRGRRRGSGGGGQGAGQRGSNQSGASRSGASRQGSSQRGGGQRGGSGRSRSAGGGPSRATPEVAAIVAPAAESAPERGASGRAVSHRARRRAVVLAAVPGVVVLLLVGAIAALAASPLIGLVAGIVSGLVWWMVTLRAGRRVLLHALHAYAPDEERIARAENLVDGLCATMGLASPVMLVVDDPSRNAIALGRRPADAALVVTSGLLSSLGPVPLEGVLAHELAHIKRGDVAPATVAAAVLLPLAVFVPSVGGIVHRWAGIGREFRADADAVRVTRFPPGLREALATMAEGPAPRPPSPLADSAVARSTRWLWALALPGPGAPDAPGAPGPSEVGRLDEPAVRIAALDEW